MCILKSALAKFLWLLLPDLYEIKKSLRVEIYQKSVAEMSIFKFCASPQKNYLFQWIICIHTHVTPVTNFLRVSMSIQRGGEAT